MDKTELTNYVATQSGLSKKEAALAVKTTLEGIAGSLKRGENVALHGFGNFQVGKLTDAGISKTAGTLFCSLSS